MGRQTLLASWADLQGQTIQAVARDRSRVAQSGDGGDPRLRKLKLATENFFQHRAGTPAAQNGWATFKAARKHLKGAR